MPESTTAILRAAASHGSGNQRLEESESGAWPPIAPRGLGLWRALPVGSDRQGAARSRVQVPSRETSLNVGRSSMLAMFVSSSPWVTECLQ